MKTLARFLCLTLLVSISLTPLFAGKAKGYQGKGIDLKQYKTYRWMPPKVLTKTGVIENHPANGVLKEIVGRELAKVGLKEAAEGGDLEIQALVLTENVPQLEAVIMGGGYMYDFGTPIATMGRYNHEGSLYLNMIDPKIKKSAWLGMVTESLPNGTLRDDEVRSKLQKAASKIFDKYPVKSK